MACQGPNLHSRFYAADMRIKLQLLEGGTKPLIEARAGMNVLQPGPAITPMKMGPIQFNAAGAYNLVIDVDGQADPIIIPFTVQLVIQQPIGGVHGMMPPQR